MPTAVLFLHDLHAHGQPDYDAAEAQIAAPAWPADARLLHVYNKRDPDRHPAEADALLLVGTHRRSCSGCASAAAAACGWHAAPEGLFIARAAARACCSARQHLLQARQRCDEPEAALELLAEELRLAHDALAEITGALLGRRSAGRDLPRFLHREVTWIPRPSNGI